MAAAAATGEGASADSAPAAAAAPTRSLVRAVESLPADVQRQIAESKFLFGRTRFVFEHALETYYDALCAADPQADAAAGGGADSQVPVTPRTVFVPLSAADLQLLRRACERRYAAAAQQQRTADTCDAGTAADAKAIDPGDDAAALTALYARIDAQTRAAFGATAVDGSGMFVKLSLRSPKDALSDTPNADMRARVLRYVAASPLASSSSDASAAERVRVCNRDCEWFVNTTRTRLRVHGARDAFERLVLRSARVREDVQRTLEFPGAFGLNVVVREFVAMSAALEFRAFVYGGHLTAVSQYCSGQFFPELAQATNRAHALAAIRRCFARAGPRIARGAPQLKGNYVLDFVVIRNPASAPAPDAAATAHSSSSAADRYDPVAAVVNAPPTAADPNVSPYAYAQVVEINPFFSDTGSCLYAWKSEADRAILRGPPAVAGAVDFRVRTHPLDDAYAHLPAVWADVFRGARQLPVPKPAAAAATPAGAPTQQQPPTQVPGAVVLFAAVALTIALLWWQLQRHK